MEAEEDQHIVECSDGMEDTDPEELKLQEHQQDLHLEEASKGTLSKQEGTVTGDETMSSLGMLEQLPVELVLEILSFFNPRDLVMVFRVCKRMHQLAKWKYVAQNLILTQ